MPDSAETLSPLTFRRHIRHALAHLYDADVLSNHPLVYQLGLAQEPDRSHALRQRLIGAIQSTKPAADDTPETPCWQMHHILMQRYVRCINAEALADQLGMSSRHLRRLQTRAVAQLSDILARQITNEQPQAHAPILQSGGQPMDLQAVDRELAWLRTAVGATSNVGEAIDGALAVVQAIAQRRGIEVTCDVEPELPKVAVHPIGLRQAFLSLVNHAVEQAAGGEVRLAATAVPGQVLVTIEARPWSAAGARPAPSSLVVAERILSMSGGDLQEERTTTGNLCLRASLAQVGATPILVIDDNADTLQLYERYLAGTRYRLATCQDPEQALALALSLKPQAIIVDIMMPGVDGWSLLGRLRHHPVLASLPIIVCSIVPESNLAHSLGAADFVRKPVTRTAFLAALDRQSAAAGPGSG